MIHPKVENTRKAKKICEDLLNISLIEGQIFIIFLSVSEKYF